MDSKHAKLNGKPVIIQRANQPGAHHTVLALVVNIRISTQTFAQLFKRFRAALRAADIAKPQARFIRQQTIAQRARLFKRRQGGEDSGIVGQHRLGKAALVAAGNAQRRILHGYGGDGHNRARAAHCCFTHIPATRPAR